MWRRELEVSLWIRNVSRPERPGTPNGTLLNARLGGGIQSSNRYLRVSIRDRCPMPLISVRLIKPGIGCSA